MYNLCIILKEYRKIKIKIISDQSIPHLIMFNSLNKLKMQLNINSKTYEFSSEFERKEINSSNCMILKYNFP